MYHHPLASFLVFTSLFMFFELVSALTFWAVAALYTSSLTQPSLAVEDNYLGGRMHGSSTETDTTIRRGQGVEDEEDEDSGTVTGPESEAEGSAQAQSRASLQARDAQERYDARRAELLRNEAEGRRMTAVDAPSGSGLDDLDLMAQGRRVLGRLDEETEEETDIAPSEASIGWEDVGDEETEQENDQRQGFGGLRRRKGDEEPRESTVGGSSTSRASSSVRSFGASSLGTVTGGAPSSTAPSVFNSRSQSLATPEIKEEDATPEPGSLD